MISSNSEITFEGIWRDGRYLVLDLRNHRFPLRCIKSNQPVPGLTYHKFEWIAAAPLIEMLLFFIEILLRLSLTRFFFGKSIYVSLGLAEMYDQRRNKRIGWRLALGGLTGLIVFAFIYITAMAAGVEDSTGDLLMCAPLMLSFATFIGIFLLICAYFPVLRVRKSERNHIWIEGAHPKFLAKLPIWKGGQRISHPPDFSGIRESDHRI